MGLVSWEDLKWLVHVTNRPLQPITQLHFADWSVQNTAIYVPITFEKWIRFIANHYNVTPQGREAFLHICLSQFYCVAIFFWGSWFQLVVSLKNFISLIIPLLLLLIYLLPAYVFVSYLFIAYLFISVRTSAVPKLIIWLWRKVVENLHSALEIARGQIDLCEDFSHLLNCQKLFMCTLFYIPKEVESKLRLGDTW